jgi:hypothetical protein
MSVLWGLTGSLDTRMVGDSKSADVTYDAALSNVLGKPPAAADDSLISNVGEATVSSTILKKPAAKGGRRKKAPVVVAEASDFILAAGTLALIECVGFIWPSGYGCAFFTDGHVLHACSQQPWLPYCCYSALCCLL